MVLYLFWVYQNYPLLEKFCCEHYFLGLNPKFGVDFFSQISWLWAMGNTTLFPVRSPLVTYTGHTSALLRGWFLTTTGNVPLCLYICCDFLVFKIKVMENTLDDVSSKWLIKIFMIKFYQINSMKILTNINLPHISPVNWPSIKLYMGNYSYYCIRNGRVDHGCSIINSWSAFWKVLASVSYSNPTCLKVEADLDEDLISAYY